MKFRFYIALFISKLIVLIMETFKVHGGSNISGKIAMRICPDFIKYIKNIDYNKAIYVTGTNGKSTTSNMIANGLMNAGKTVANNKEGANLTTGLATALLKNSSWGGSLKTEYLVFESDERYLSRNYNLVPAKYILVTNIQKDQVQRNGTPEIIHNILKETMIKADTVFLNGDEPNSYSFKDLVKNPIIYSVEKNSKSYVNENRDSYTMACYKCSSNIEFEFNNIDKVGKFSCTGCDLKSDEGKYRVTDVDYKNRKMKVSGHEYYMPYDQAFFLYAYAGTIGILREFGLNEAEIDASFRKFRNVDGRVETIIYDYEDSKKSKEVKFIRIKQENSETLQSAVDYVASDKNKKAVILAFDQVEDLVPYYVNAFYPFEVDFSKLNDGNLENIICFGEIVSYDVKNRLLYNGIPEEKITVVARQDSENLFKEIEKEGFTDNIYLITTLMRYEDIVDKMKGNVRIKGK